MLLKLKWTDVRLWRFVPQPAASFGWDIALCHYLSCHCVLPENRTPLLPSHQYEFGRPASAHAFRSPPLPVPLGPRRRRFPADGSSAFTCFGVGFPRTRDGSVWAPAARRLRRRQASVTMTAPAGGPGSWSENILEYFLRNNQITTEDGAEIIWYHAANHKAQMKEALRSSAHMIEADVLLPSDGSEHGQPIMAHPPETNSDNTLQEWLTEVVKSNKGIKLDFKSLAAVEPSMRLLENVKRHLKRPVWINADILPGPNGSNRVVDAKPFIDTVTAFFPDVTFSLGWTTGWHPEKVNEGYSWTMVKQMDSVCSELSQPVTFPVRAALVRQSCSQLLWLLKKSNRLSNELVLRSLHPKAISQRLAEQS
ncbi:protein FAM151B isoform X2 [Tupaia chinensis]|uniref:protein FAM151B isoform X2 n=1 Tax=Tupaia chinensis TaxID=246437 RepID=UPI000703DBF6|nr:protein FAM151B isoform X2 [Tupaia chinensis]